MEIIGIVLLLGLFGLGVVIIYFFLQYLDLLKAERDFHTELISRMKALEEKIRNINRKEQGKVSDISEEKEMG